MYEIKKQLTKENLLSEVTDFEIFKAYCPNFIQIGKKFSSPFREDVNPSCCISMYDKLMFIDFAEGKPMDCFEYVKSIYNLTFFEVLIKINQDFGLNLDFNDKYHKIQCEPINRICVPPISKNTKSIIKVLPRKYNKLDKEFWWDKYHISSQRLIKSNTFPLISIFIKNNKTENEFIRKNMDKLCYGYYFYKHNNIDLWKIYSPNRDQKNGKWISNIDSTVIDGINEIPKQGDLLIISKARKDRLLLNELGYNAISTNNEGSFIPKINILKLKQRYKNIVVYFDNDVTGITKGSEFAEKYGLLHIYNHKNDPKDIADIQSEWRDFNLTKKYIKELINDRII